MLGKTVDSAIFFGEMPKWNETLAQKQASNNNSSNNNNRQISIHVQRNILCTYPKK